MLCKSPVQFRKVSSEAAFPCGQCIACRINKRRIWSHRIMLEAMRHTSNSFITLTYDDDHLPKDEFYHPKTGQVYAPFSVNPEHHRLFFNSLRYHYHQHFPRQYDADGNCINNLRFYMVGEYGDSTQRPHYHYALFGYPRCSDGARTIGRKFFPCRCPSCSLISKVWSKGNIFVGNLTLESANYIAGYVTKKLTNDKSQYNQDILQGRHPEFSRMSRMPGIGLATVDAMHNSLAGYDLEDYTIPRVLVHGSKSLPLGRYLSDKLHEKLGITFQPGEKLRNYEKQLRAMFLSEAKTNPEAARASYFSVGAALSMLNAQPVLDLERKRVLFSKEKTI